QMKPESNGSINPLLKNLVQRDHLETPVPRIPIQAQLTIGAPGDKYEQEADQVAHNVVEQINAPAPNSTQSDASVQREMVAEDDQMQMKPIVQRQELDGGVEAPTEIESSINQAKGSGQSLDADLEQSMGKAMGADFSGVKVHTDNQADTLNQSLQAKAFTTGQHVFFKKGEYQPSNKGGQELIAHELTHVVQQNSIQRATIQRIDDVHQEEGHSIPVERGRIMPHQPESSVVTQDQVELGQSGIYPIYEESGNIERRQQQVKFLRRSAKLAAVRWKQFVQQIVDNTNLSLDPNPIGSTDVSEKEKPCHHTGFDYIIKSEGRSMEKAQDVANDWNEGVALSLMDVLRATISCKNDQVIDEVMYQVEALDREILEEYDGVASIDGMNFYDRRYLDKRTEMSNGKGYADIKCKIPIRYVNVTTDGRPYTAVIRAELIVLHEQLADAKEKGGHAFYDVTRAAVDAPEVSTQAPESPKSPKPKMMVIDGSKDSAVKGAKALILPGNEKVKLAIMEAFPVENELAELYRILSELSQEQTVLISKDYVNKLKEASNKFYDMAFWNHSDLQR
ncbi:MAG: DUF4157 domain-containing protein, partial [Cyanobacteria bacterium J06592_8]